ncbi:PAS domain S-box protein [Pseudorhodoferax sp. Leaf267]|uniref:PAS domain-containing sensor histidine kinase n=1 Tax=Pseudorhodoferax sp. Leaf267 TaxID=1736316 RepID=UPI000AEF6883|nr:PAS domain S-box protein [Pseudorhodoferax sp. Leaf267]
MTADPAAAPGTPREPVAAATQPAACAAVQLLVHARDGVVATDAQGLVTEWNPSAERMLGWLRAEAIGQPLSALVVPVHPAESHETGLEPYLRSGAARGLDGLLEIDVLRRDGRQITLELSIFSLPGQSGEASGIFLRDVSERQSTQKAVRQSEARYRSLVEHLGEGMAVIQDGRVAFTNARAIAIMRVDAATVVGADYLPWLHPDDRPLAAQRQHARQRGDDVPRRYELRRLDEDGTVRWLDVHATAVPWEGRPATMAFFSDISASKVTTEALRVSEERYRAVVEHLSEGMIVIQDEKVVYANPRAAEIAGLPLAQMQQIGFLTRIHPDDQALVLDRQRRRLAGEQPPDHYELRLLLPGDVVRWIAIGVAVVPWGGKPAALTFFTDVTERKAMLEEIRVSEERLRAVVEHAGEGTLVAIDLDKPVFVNARALQIMRMTREELEQQGYLHLLHPDDLPMVVERRRRRLAGDPVVGRYEVRLMDRDGGVRWIDMGTTVVPWSGQKATLTFFTDVSRRKALEARLRDTLAERETILENSLVGIAFLTQDRKLRWANRAMTRIFRSDRAMRLDPDWQSVDFQSFFPRPEDYARAGAEIKARMRAQLTFEGELQLRRGDGTLFWASITGKAVNASDAAHGTVWTVMDITERKALEVALQRTSSEREAIFGSVLVGIAFNVNRHIRWVNDKFVEMMGYSREELTGRSSRMLYPDDESYTREGVLTLQHLQRDGSYISERQMVRKNGERIWVQLAGRCVFGKNPEAGAIWTFLDITDRKRAEDDVRAALERQQELNVLRSRFVAMTSHEFRTPLATILSSAELIRHYRDRMSEAETQEVLDGVEAGVQRMTGMLDRMLLIGKADAQMLDFQPLPLDLRALCQRCVAEARSQYPGRADDIVLEYQCTRGTGAFDEKLLRHVLGNLLSNAVKYSPAGGAVRLRVTDQGEGWAFEVSDHGIGIPLQEQGHLFESFHRASNVGDIPGTGLGLAIVKKAVEVHGGTIEVRSEAGDGCCFKVRIG